ARGCGARGCGGVRAGQPAGTRVRAAMRAAMRAAEATVAPPVVTAGSLGAVYTAMTSGACPGG
ncbi:MAG TPA: hypothetical protein VGH99_01225, partial [Pseudonocardia sp.]